MELKISWSSLEIRISYQFFKVSLLSFDPIGGWGVADLYFRDLGLRAFPRPLVSQVQQLF